MSVLGIDLHRHAAPHCVAVEVCSGLGDHGDLDAARGILASVGLSIAVYAVIAMALWIFVF